MPGQKILVVEDDPQTLERLRQTLAAEGFEIRVACTGEEALDQAFEFHPELIVLDIDLPAMAQGERLDGLRVLEALRDDSSIPVLMLTATSASSVKVFAFAIGADDYVTKPYDSKELVARARALLRRSGAMKGEEEVLRFRRLTIDANARKVWKDGREVELTTLELDLLLVLARRPGWAFTRSQLIRGAWKYDRYGDERIVDSHIGHLRRKIEDDFSRPGFIATVRGVGYRFEDEPV